MTTPDLAHHVYRFGEFTLDIERGAVLKADQQIKLRPKAFEVLCYLVARHGQLVSKDELLDAVWSPAVVTEDSVTQCLMEIRQAIDDHDHALIRTVPRRGYIFEGAVAGPETVPDPDRHAASLPAAQPIQAPRQQRRAAMLATLAAASFVLWWGLAGRHTADAPATNSTASAAAEATAIAVLPFTDMSPDSDQTWFADGISDEIINRLTHIPGVRVIARTSSFSFRSQQAQADIDQIAEQLGVDHILEGSVRKSGDQVRVTAQLIRTADSSHLWSQTYERKLENVFQVQDEIAAAVAAALEKNLPPTAGHATTSIDPKAYGHYLQGRFFFNRRNPGDIGLALHHYGQAVRLDPGFARAWAGLAGAWKVLSWEDPAADWAASRAQLKASAERAIALDPTLAEAHVRLGDYYYGTHGRAGALPHYEKAFALEPDDPFILMMRAFEAEEDGNLAKAIALQRRAIAEDPLSQTHRSWLVGFLKRDHRLAEARAEIELAQQLSPGSRAKLESHLLDVSLLEGNFDEALALARPLPPGERRDHALAMIHGRTGNAQGYRAAMARLEARQDVASAVALAEVHGFLDNPDAAFKWLDVARSRTVAPQRDRASWQRLSQTRFSPFLKHARADPRWDQGRKAMSARYDQLREGYAGD